MERSTRDQANHPRHDDGETGNCSALNNPFSGCDATILDMPSEILDYIFCFLTIKERVRTELVCLRFRELGKTVSWSWPIKLGCKVLQLNYVKKEHAGIFLSSILSRCGKSLRVVEMDLDSPMMRGEQLLTSKVFEELGNNCPNLLEIKIKGWPQDCSSSHLTVLSTGCKKLKKVFLDLRVTLSLYKLLPYNFLQQFQDLEYLLINCYGTNRSIAGINLGWAEISRSLKCFYIASDFLVDSVAEQLVMRCDRIEELCLTCLPDWQAAISIPMLMRVLGFYKNTLRVLYLQDCSMKPEEWNEILGMLEHLELLSLPHAAGVNDNFLKILVKKCTKLQSLNIDRANITDAGVALLGNARNLKMLNLSNTSTTSAWVKNVAASGLLERVHFGANHDDGFQANCISLLNLCPNLRVVDVSDSVIVTNKLVEDFSFLLESGVVKGPIKLHVANTLVTQNVSCCDKLRLYFTNGIFDDLNSKFWWY